MIWRVGRHQPRNIYYDDEFVAVAIGDAALAADVALIICAALNRVEADMKSKSDGIAAPCHSKETGQPQPGG